MAGSVVEEVGLGVGDVVAELPVSEVTFSANLFIDTRSCLCGRLTRQVYAQDRSPCLDVPDCSLPDIYKLSAAIVHAEGVNQKATYAIGSIAIAAARAPRRAPRRGVAVAVAVAVAVLVRPILARTKTLSRRLCSRSCC